MPTNPPQHRALNPIVPSAIAKISCRDRRWETQPHIAPDRSIFASKTGLIIDGVQLAEYAIEVNLGGSVVSEYQIKRLDLDYFDGE